MDLQLAEGDLLDQDVEVIVNAWNRNLIPWWLLLPQGVSGAIKRRGGIGPFRELGRLGMIPLGGAVVTAPGKLPFKAIIHVAGINMLWRSSEWSVCASVRNVMALASERGYRSIAFPLIGAGSGGGNAERVRRWMVKNSSRLSLTGEWWSSSIANGNREASRGSRNGTEAVPYISSSVFHRCFIRG